MQLWQVSEHSVSVCLIVSSWWLSFGLAHLGWFQSCWGREGWGDAGIRRRACARRGQNLLCLLNSSAPTLPAPLLSESEMDLQIDQSPCSWFWLEGSESFMFCNLADPCSSLCPVGQWGMTVEITNCEIILKTMQHIPTFPHPPAPHWITHNPPSVSVSGPPHLAQPCTSFITPSLHPSSRFGPWLAEPFCRGLFKSNSGVYFTLALSK